MVLKVDKYSKLGGLGDNLNPNLPRGNLNAKIIVLSHPKFERDRLHLRTKCSINVLELILGTEIDIETLEQKKIIKIKNTKRHKSRHNYEHSRIWYS